MGTLQQTSTGRRVTLGPRTLVGRAATCRIVLGDGRISAEHAVLWWEGGWQIRDLGSKNGTFVDGNRVDTATVLSRDGLIGFGSVSDPWILWDDTPPPPSARCGETLVVGTGELLLLPDAEAPQIAIFRDGHQRWVKEENGLLQGVASGDAVGRPDEPWVLELPDLLPPTAEGEVLVLLEVGLIFEVSRDEEHVAVTLRTPTGPKVLGARSHHFVLLQLARAWLEEVDQTPTERGWVYQDDLVRQLGIETTLLHIHIHRSRRQLADAGVLDCAGLVQRRPGAGQLRIGVGDLDIVHG